MENATPKITTDVWSAVNPPAYNKTPANIPNNIAHVTLYIIGESSLILLSLLDESIDATSAPESDDVTKKVTISTNENIDAILGIG